MMKTEEIEDGDVCPYCGVLAIFFEGEDELACPSCGSQLFNSAVPHDILHNDLDDEEIEIVRAEEADWEEADRTDFGDPEVDGDY
jgi:DNA-directed RNA polymerase subunit RPC12/RpoP